MDRSNDHLYFYRRNKLVTSIKDAESISLLYGGYMPLAEVGHKDAAVAAGLYGVDALNTIQSNRQEKSKSYTAFGFLHGSATPRTLLGFTGQYCQLNGIYFLGNGYRAYNPMLMRFCSADAFSPFGKGGINAYVYCGSDPVNYSDPSGRWRWLRKNLTRLTGLSSKVKTYDKGKTDGHANGLAEGRADGLAEGYANGLAEGHANGLAEGRATGLAEGRATGLAEGRATGLDEGRQWGHEEGFARATNGKIQWNKWMMDPAYADQTLQQALDNAYQGVEPYKVATNYGGRSNDVLHAIYSLASGVRNNGVTMEGSLSYLLDGGFGALRDPRR
ncbi:RHS repeat-associated protein [Pseudomonas sp. Y3 TE3536]